MHYQGMISAFCNRQLNAPRFCVSYHRIHMYPGIGCLANTFNYLPALAGACRLGMLCVYRAVDYVSMMYIGGCRHML